jgi:hypothetical protein
MKTQGLLAVLFSLSLLACGTRTLPMLDGQTLAEAAARRDQASMDTFRSSDAPSFCSGAARASINDSPLTVQDIIPHPYVSQAHLEGADVEILGTLGGSSWSIRAEIAPQGLTTVTDQPLPQTLSIGTSGSMDVSVFVNSPPVCPSSSGSQCTTGLFLGESHSVFTGQLTLSGQDYGGPCQLALCLSASGGSPAFPEIQSVQISLPLVTIPFWRMPGF